MRIEPDEADWLDEVVTWWVGELGPVGSTLLLDRLRDTVPPGPRDGPYR